MHLGKDFHNAVAVEVQMAGFVHFVHHEPQQLIIQEPQCYNRGVQLPFI